MPAWMLPAALAGGQAIVGAIGQGKANKANRDEARRNRQFQERMSGTAFQRSKKDMLKAGLNPAMMYGSAGAASSPSGAAAMSQQSVTKELGTGVASALQVKRLEAELKLLEAQTKKTKGEAMGAEVDGLMTLDRWQRLNDQGGRDTLGGEVTTPNPRTLQRLFEAEFDKTIDTATAVKINNILRRLQVPGGEASAQIWAEISKLPPQARAGLVMMLGAMGRPMPIGGGR